MQRLILVLILLLSRLIFAQDDITHKELKINRVDNAPKIDGVLDDDAWQNANSATDFVMFRPTSGTKEPSNIKTEVKVVYDDEAIYFGAYLHDDKPEEIPMEFQTRDNFGNADFFGVILNPQNDGINQTEFFVMSTGNQNDSKATNNGEDFSWNAVWDSEVQLVDDGWIVEMKIPYSALRFSNEKIQTWGLNFHRHHRKNKDQYSWNFISREKGNIGQYDGLITGIKNIKPPVRLSFNPFIFGSTSSFAGETDFDWSAGLDVKYGISENFTLDATLIPDFGQVAFDDVTLNLGPFEQQFSDNRAFFTEGTDLFSKGDLFYTRRVGNAPIGIDLADNEAYDNLPTKVDMLNAIKVSGRTKKGLGIGVFNAITEKTKGQIKTTKTINSEEIITYRNEVLEPLANYNVLVVDQQFNKKSSVSLINTNVMREGSFRDANVTAFLYDITTKNDKFEFEGGFATSTIYNNKDTKTGFEGVFEASKISGKNRYGIEANFITKNYDKNDLGFQRRNNEVNYEAYYNYRTIEPKGKFNRHNFFVVGETSYLMESDKSMASYQAKPNLYTGNRMQLHYDATTKKQITFGGNIRTAIGDQYDYFEPRTEGRFYKLKPFLGIGFFVSTDYTKRLAVDVSLYYSKRFDNVRDFTSISISPRFRVSDKFSLTYDFASRITNNLKGYVADLDDAIIFGNRDERSVTNAITAKYNFSTKSALGLSFRHFWSPVTYDSQYFKLENDGTLSENNYTKNHDINYNIWNVDLSYNWEFAPGSQLVALYRNKIFNEDNQSQLSFTDNLDNLFQQDQLHNISLKLIYYLDYNKAKTWL